MKTPLPPHSSLPSKKRINFSTFIKITALTALSFLWSSSATFGGRRGRGIARHICRRNGSTRSGSAQIGIGSALKTTSRLIASPLLHLPVTAAFAFVPSNSSSATMSTTSAASASATTKRTPSSLSSTSNTETDSTTKSGDSASSTHPLSKLIHSFDHSWVNQLSTETKANRSKSQSMVGGPKYDNGTSNNVKRPVFNGHWVRTTPDPLKNPRLVIHSPDVLKDLGLLHEDDVGNGDRGLDIAHSEQFVKYFSGNVKGAIADYVSDQDIEGKIETWATPYALSIMGQRYTSNCPFNTGDGYGDGRAMSIGEVKVDTEEKKMSSSSDSDSSSSSSHSRYELQLKGAGPTPFCRGADGRAVLRSSIREFLASEAMHYLGISTTRALSLIVSEDDEDRNVKGNTSQRPWYSESNEKRIPDINDPRLSRYSPEQRKQILAQLNAQTRNDPDVMIEEPNAITCRVAPSFTRVGHIDLFSRRATKNLMSDNEKPDPTTTEFKELEALIWHACYREFPSTCYEPHRSSGDDGHDIVAASKCLLRESLDGIATMVGHWVRVGFTQGNFNADNCLVAGRTMDYGPFGYVEEYHPLFAKWTGSGEHFGFLNQPNAGYANFVMLVSSVMPIIEAYDEDETMVNAKKFKEEILEEGQKVFEEKLMENLRPKLGFHEGDESADELWQDVELLMRENRVDWTLFWRQLTYVVQAFPLDAKNPSKAYCEMFDVLTNADGDEAKSPFYEQLDTEGRNQFLKWIQSWRENLEQAYDIDNYGSSVVLSQEENTNTSVASAFERMRQANPKFVLREWMLVDAYTKASTSDIQMMNNPMFPMKRKMKSSEQGDESLIHELFELIQKPYDEGTDNQDNKYYRRASKEALKKGGVAFMS